VQRAFDEFGERHFDAKRSGTWRRLRNGVEVAFNLQKSQYSLAYYLNLDLDFTAAVPTDLAQDENDLGYPFQIDGRVDDFLRWEDTQQLRMLLDIEQYAMPEEHREHELLEFLEGHLCPVLDELQSLEGLVAFERSATWERFMVTRSARRVLTALTALSTD
jgi:hypothetical protein